MGGEIGRMSKPQKLWGFFAGRRKFLWHDFCKPEWTSGGVEMKDGGRDKNLQQTHEATSAHSADHLPIDIAGIIGGRARRVPDSSGRAADSMLAIYKNRLTYTFICDNDVASIHYDAAKHEIFFRGHNIKFMALSESHITALHELAAILAGDREGKRLCQDYQETLALLLADNQ